MNRIRQFLDNSPSIPEIMDFVEQEAQRIVKEETAEAPTAPAGNKITPNRDYHGLCSQVV